MKTSEFPLKCIEQILVQTRVLCLGSDFLSWILWIKKVRLFKSNKSIWDRILILRHCNRVYSYDSKIHRQEFSWFCGNEKKVGLQRQDGSGCPYYVYCSISINVDFDFGMITNENRVYGLLDRWVIYVVHFQSLSATISVEG